VKDFFKLEQVNVQQGLDLVNLQLGSNQIRLYYHTTFSICSSLQGATKLAMQNEGLKPDFWHKLIKYDWKGVDTPMHKTYRRSGHQSNLTDWEVAFEGSLVVLKLDDLTAKFHFSDAAKLQVWLRRAAKQAKNWSGDRSRIWNTFARLTDAEENDKRLVVK